MDSLTRGVIQEADGYVRSENDEEFRASLKEYAASGIMPPRHKKVEWVSDALSENQIPDEVYYVEFRAKTWARRGWNAYNDTEPYTTLGAAQQLADTLAYREGERLDVRVATYRRVH